MKQNSQRVIKFVVCLVYFYDEKKEEKEDECNGMSNLIESHRRMRIEYTINDKPIEDRQN